MDAKETLEHVLGGFTILLILDTSKPSGSNGYSWNLGGMFTRFLLLHVPHIVAFIRFYVKQCKLALSLSLHSLKGSTQIGVEYEHSPLVSMQGMKFTFSSIHVGG